MVCPLRIQVEGAGSGSGAATAQLPKLYVPESTPLLQVLLCELQVLPKLTEALR